MQGLPVRGQRTKTNARTRKGKVKTVAGKKKVSGIDGADCSRILLLNDSQTLTWLCTFCISTGGQVSLMQSHAGQSFHVTYGSWWKKGLTLA